MKLIIANWKNKPQTAKEAVELFNKIVKNVQDVKNVQVVICPPFNYLSSFELNVKSLELGCQNTFVKKDETNDQKISWPEAKKHGATFAIVGHSSRRIFLSETDEAINQELKEVLSLGFTPILCIGETAQQRKENKTEEVLKNQLQKGLAGIANIDDLVIAYEPIWAISCGDPYATKTMPTKENISEIKNLIKEIVGNCKVIYGGSTNAANAKDFLEESGMDGLLVGGASLSSEEFVKMVKNI